MTISTRFAPSPTGYLHIGGVRTALFNYLLARQKDGRYVLRIDDTDAARNVDQALQPILDGFRWLGLDWDAGPEVGGPDEPYFQSQRTASHREAVQALLASGAAYHDYSTAEELQAARSAAESAGVRFVYDRQWAAFNDADRQRFEDQGRTAVVRLKMPREGVCRFDDVVRGTVEVEWDQEPDHVIARSDGSPLYHLASVVDDQAMGVTHVVRAVEHLPNTPRQIFIARSLGYPLPTYAHLPYVAEPGGTAKLSKRKLEKYLKNPGFSELYQTGKKIADLLKIDQTPELFNPVVVDFYREIGFLPQAILNYLLLLGWSLDDSREDFTLDEAIELFSLERVQKSPASFDPQKLMAFQTRAMSRLSADEKLPLIQPMLQRAGWLPSDLDETRQAWLQRVIELAGDRLRIAGDIFEFNELFCRDDELPMDEKAVNKRLKNDAAKAILKDFVEEFSRVPTRRSEAAAEFCQRFAEQRQLKIGDLMNPLRIALTGKTSGLAVYDYLELLDQPSIARRIERAIQT